MRISCSSAKSTMSDDLIDSIEKLGLKPIITPILVRVVYDGPNTNLGNKIVALFDQEKDKEIVVDYNDAKQNKKGKQRVKQVVAINSSKN